MRVPLGGGGPEREDAPLRCPLLATLERRSKHRGLRTSSTYSVRQAVEDWLASGLPGRAERTRRCYQSATAPLLEHIGSKPLRELTAGDVRSGLEAAAG